MGVAGTYLLYILMSFVISLIFGSVFGFFMAFLKEYRDITTALYIIYAVFYVLLTLFLGAIGRALMVTIFYNLKIKNESFGVESMVKDYVDGPDVRDADEK